MKGFRSFIPALTLAGALLAASLPGSVGAQGTRTFSSGFQVQNLTSAEATLSMAFYPEGNGTPSDTVPATIDPSSSVTFATLPDAVDAGFKGSAVISSDQRIAAIVNLLSPSLSALVGQTAGSIGEAYVGVTGGAQEVAVPLLFKNFSGFNTFFNVQNVGQAATSVTVTYQGAGLNAPLVSDPVNIPPGAAVRFDQLANTQLPDGFNGSAIIRSTASDVAAVVTQYNARTALVYNGFAGGATEPVFPLVNTNNAGFATGIALQNTGDTATEVTVSYTPSGAGLGTACTETQTIGPNGETKYFAIDAFASTRAGENCADGVLFVGSATVTTNSTSQPLVAIVNQLRSANSNFKGGTYSSFDPATATNTVVFPLIQDRVARFFTGLSLVNVGDVATTIECSYTNTQIKQTSETIQPGGTYTVQQVNAIAQSYNGSGTCVATANGAKIVGIANQLRSGTPVDAFFVYEGTND